MGLIIYAKYWNCDPIKSQVMETYIIIMCMDLRISLPLPIDVTNSENKVLYYELRWISALNNNLLKNNLTLNYLPHLIPYVQFDAQLLFKTWLLDFMLLWRSKANAKFLNLHITQESFSKFNSEFILSRWRNLKTKLFTPFWVEIFAKIIFKYSEVSCEKILLCYITLFNNCRIFDKWSK